MQFKLFAVWLPIFKAAIMTTLSSALPTTPPNNEADAGKLLSALRDELASTRHRLQALATAGIMPIGSSCKSVADSESDLSLLTPAELTTVISPKRRTSLNNQALLLHDVSALARQPPYARTTRRKELLEAVDFPAGLCYDAVDPARPLSLVPEEMRALTGSFAFNALEMDVPTMMVHWFVMFQELDLLAKFSIAPETLRELFRCVHNGYRENTYHNFQHAMDVSQFTFALWSNSPEIRAKFDDCDMLACVLLGLAHDMDHPGVNNNFLIKTRDPIAILYNDRSVLENSHAASLFYLLMTRPDANILKTLDAAQYERVRKFVLSGILATDMSRHFELLGAMKNMPAAVESEVLDEKQRLSLVDLIAKASDICHLVSGKEA